VNEIEEARFQARLRLLKAAYLSFTAILVALILILSS
jgi:hypothetical protein